MVRSRRAGVGEAAVHRGLGHAGSLSVVVRAGYIWWFLALALAGLETFALLTSWATTTDMIFGRVVFGALLGATLGMTTSRWSINGRTLVGVAMLRIFRIDADQIAGFDDENGLAVVLHSGHRLELGICEPSLAQLLIRNRRRRREAAVLRAWLSSMRSAPVAGWQPSQWVTTIRWTAVAGIVTSTAIPPLLGLAGAF
jgi:hypothetical protein